MKLHIALGVTPDGDFLLGEHLRARRRIATQEFELSLHVTVGVFTSP